MWDLKTRKLLHTISAVFVQVVDWSPDGERLAMSNGNQGPVQVIDVESGQVVMVLRGHIAPGVAFVGDGDRLVSVGGVEGDLRVWNVSRNGPPALGAITALVDGPFGYEFSPDGAQVATITGRGGGAVEILGADSGGYSAHHSLTPAGSSSVLPGVWSPRCGATCRARSTT